MMYRNRWHACDSHLNNFTTVLVTLYIHIHFTCCLLTITEEMIKI